MLKAPAISARIQLLCIDWTRNYEHAEDEKDL
jgi:hypothetical protein